MTNIKLETLTLKSFDKENINHLKFFKKLINDETIKIRFQGLLPYLLNKNETIFSHGFLVEHNDILIGYIDIGEYNKEEKQVYLRAAISDKFRGQKYGQKLLSEISEYIFSNFIQVENICLKIDSNNTPSLKIADACNYKWLEKDIYKKNNPYKKKTI